MVEKVWLVSMGEVLKSLNPEGVIKVRGELWKKVCTDDSIDAQEEVVVIGIEGPKLLVKRKDIGEQGEANLGLLVRRAGRVRMPHCVLTLPAAFELNTYSVSLYADRPPVMIPLIKLDLSSIELAG